MPAQHVKPTMRDVAHLAGVSLKTVSRVVNDEPYVDAQTRTRVAEAIQSLGFRRNHVASSLRRGTASETVGLIIEDISNPFYSAIARGVEEVAQQQRYMVITGSNEKDSLRERQMVTALLQRQTPGLILVPASHNQAYLKEESEQGTHIVFLDRPAEHLRADAVLLDNRGGARRGVEHLLAQGHRRIGFVGGDPLVYTGAERIAGYREALAARGVPFDERLLKLARHGALQAEAATYELLEMEQPPTAIFADNNRMSVGVIRALRARAPQIALVGFDDIELADMLSLPITVVTHDALEMGKQGALLLFARLRGDTRAPQRIIIPTQLVVRGSGAA